LWNVRMTVDIKPLIFANPNKGTYDDR